MALNVKLINHTGNIVFTANLQNSYSRIAKALKLYRPIWRPRELAIDDAGTLTGLINKGLTTYSRDKGFFEQFIDADSDDSLEEFFEFVQGYLTACHVNPQAKVKAVIADHL